ncbi:RNA polymerase sporulation sigma factor SigE [Solibaculum mannosilyticum]|uniref:RNA polymerase sigma factor n=1 Tax=Solibaculum mannosilyticum TaxID=2780922 RepID=A0A7I8D481_9FIRM|nr:RNA polymerase sporulation sigma factor SigE [Solibaculum mannosilyticum]MCO7137581.1 RNA polymerase sporulation sigma factor SigE [[Clostridium] leptum]BCI60562.1 RNA polymerase sporulation sigma factor SigE [Solibaculum mannosilyticum]CZT56942.1 RNA polymerase sigma-35 factor precursor [Eubacteriaceae bacterium CHKCI005]
MGEMLGRIRWNLLRLRFLLLRKWKSGRSVHYINGPETLPPPLPKEEEAVIFRRIDAGDESAREPLITHNLRLVVYIARKFESSGTGVEDLISIGTIGLIKAVNTFCPSRNIKLATYASRCIENEILMHLRKSSQLKNEVSIDEPLNVDWDGNELLYSDVLGSDPDLVNRGIEQQVERDLLLEAVDRLSPREQIIMKLRFGLKGETEHTQKEVAELLGISQSYISRLEKRIIERLKKDLVRVG